MNYSDKETERLLEELEKRLGKTYKDANTKTSAILADYLEKFEERDDKLREELKDKEKYKAKYCVGASAYMTPEEHYKQWRLAQIGRGKRWEAVKKQIANRITETNKTAEGIINDSLYGIYALNHNFSAYEIEKESGVAFNIVDENTVRELEKNKNHTEFRTVKVNPKRDYAWNSQKIHNSLTSGILQGLSIPHITDSFMEVMQSNRKAAIRNARTSVTSAQNAGRVESYKQAEKLGISLEQEWMSAHDGRVRDSHAHLDGVRVKVGFAFPNGCMYPADPKGKPEEVYNCRCTLKAILPKYNGKVRTNNTVENYKLWEINKKKYFANSRFGKEKVYFNNNVDYKIQLKAYDENINNSMSKAIKNLAKLGSETMWEYCNLLNLSTGEIEFEHTDKEFSSVGGFFDHLKNNKNSKYAFIHNHNTESTLSLPDVQILETEYNIDCIVSVSNNGIINAIVSNGVKSNEYNYIEFEKEISYYKKTHAGENNLIEKSELYAVEVASKKYGREVFSNEN